MKSIIEEASSIAKAVDQAWQRAGKPQEFTVKVFEEPQKSIFGLTIRSAKIAFFFDEKSIAHESEKTAQQEVKPTFVQKEQSPAPAPHAQKPVHAKNRNVPRQQPVQDQKKNEKREQQPAKKSEKKRRAPWSDGMIEQAKQWLDACLKQANIPAVAYETSIIGNNLNIQFSHKLLEDEQKQRMLFSSFAYLMMLNIMHATKQRLPNLKVILKS